MSFQDINDYLTVVLHSIAQALMIPVMVALVGLIVFALWCLGSLLAEAVAERRHFRAHIPGLVNDIRAASYDQVETVIQNSQLLFPQKAALQMLCRNLGLREDELFALAKTEIAAADDRYRKILSRTEQVTKIAPMMGLMCTLIPLGPGILAMGKGEVTLLSQSLLIAFDGTVAGLVAAVVALVVTGIRKRWYRQYMVVLESLATCVLDKASQARSEGVELPSGFRGKILPPGVRQSVVATPGKKGNSAEKPGSPAAERVLAPAQDSLKAGTLAADVKGAAAARTDLKGGEPDGA